MPLMDIISIVLLLFFSIRGLFRGFFNELFGLAGLVIAAFVSINSYGRIGAKIVEISGLGRESANIIGFLVPFLIILIVFIVTGHWLSRAVKALHLSWLNRLAGCAFGFGKAAFGLGLVFSVLFSATDARWMQAAIRHSTLAVPLMNFSRKILDLIHLKTADGRWV